MTPLPTRRDGLGLLLGLAMWPVWGQSNAQAERQIKAAFLYKFLGFVDWPGEAFDAPDAPLRVGVVGADALADDLAQVVGRRQANGRPVAVRTLRPGEPLDGLHVLFIGRAAEPAVWAQARRQPKLLVVADTEEPLAQGAAIGFAVADDKVRFDVAPRVAEQAGLKISARLLAVARRVVAP